MHTGNLPQPGHDLFEVFEVRDVEDDLHAGLAVFGTRSDVAYITLSVANNAGNALQHPETVVAVNRKLDRVSRRRTLIAGPLHIDPSFRLLHQIRNVGTIHRVHRHSLASRDVADNALAANGIATARPV